MKVILLTLSFLFFFDSQTQTFLFSHGLIDSNEQAHRYSSILSDPHTFDYPHASKSIFKINRYKCSLAGENEIEHLYRHYQPLASTRPILMGISCGASTIVNFMGIYKPQSVAALILESPFDCVPSVISGLLNQVKMGWVPGLSDTLNGLTDKVFCKYDPNGPCPAKCAPEIEKLMPILLICSQADAVVPYSSTLQLYKILRDSGHDNTHILILPSGKHAKLINDAVYGNEYQAVVHTFYRRYGLAHDTAQADAGEYLFSLCQPNPRKLLLPIA